MPNSTVSNCMMPSPPTSTAYASLQTQLLNLQLHPLNTSKKKQTVLAIQIQHETMTRAQIYSTYETTAIRSSYIWIYILRDCHHWIKHISRTNACTLSFILSLWPFDRCRKVLLSIFACHHSSDNLQTHYTLNCKKILIIQFHVYSKYYSPQVEF